MGAQAGILEVLCDKEGGQKELLLTYFSQVYLACYVPQIGKIWCQGKDLQAVVTIHCPAALPGGEASTPPPIPPSGNVVRKGKEMRWKRGQGGSPASLEQLPKGKAVASIRGRERLSPFTEKLIRK